MTKAMYLQRGEALDYTNATNDTIEAGSVITIGERIGIAGTDIEPGAVGSIHVVGCFEIAKSEASEVIAQGASVYFDGTGITCSADDGGTPPTAYAKAGYAAAASSATDTAVLVKLNG